jgi:hypothetical protein
MVITPDVKKKKDGDGGGGSDAPAGTEPATN